MVLTSIDEERALQLKADDKRLTDFDLLGIDVDSIVEWADCHGKEKRRTRIRFIETFPVLVPMLVWKPDDPFSSAIVGWIDDGDPLVENIACLMGDVPPDVVEFLAGKPLSLVSEKWIDNELELVFALSCIPLDKRPQSVSDWTTFADYSQAIRPVPWDASGHFFSELCCLGYEPDHMEMLGLSCDESDKLGLINDYMGFLTDWAKSVIDRGYTPITNVVPFSRDALERKRNHGGVENVWINQYFSMLSASTMFRQAVAWESAFRDAVATAQRNSNDPELVQWPTLFRQPFVVDQVQVTSITTIEEAIQLGVAIEPFDGRYLESCILGDGYLVALKDQQGSHISSAMINLLTDGGQVLPYVGAHHRPNGDYAHLLEDDVLEAALVWLRNPEQQNWLQALVRFHAARRDAIREKLDALSSLTPETASRVLRKVVVDFEDVQSELLSLHN